MLDSRPSTTQPAALPSSLSPELLVRLGAVAAAAVAIWRWPGSTAAYGVTFWLWLAGLVAYVWSFPRATQARRWPSVAVLVGLIAILGLAAALRIPQIATNPANISVDELLPGFEALQIARGELGNVFSGTGWFSMPRLSFALQALLMGLTRPSFYVLRLSSAITGLAGILSVFLLARRLFGDRVALTAAFLMAVSFWHIHNSRTGFPFVQSSFCPALVLYLLLRGRQDGSRTVLAAAGICLGLALECYFPVRILLILAPICLATDWRVRGTSLRAAMEEAAVVGVGAALALGPLLISVPLDALTHHSSSVLLTNPVHVAHFEREYQVQGLWSVFRCNLAEAASMVTTTRTCQPPAAQAANVPNLRNLVWADVCVLNRSPRGLLDLGTFAALLLGTLVAVLQGRAYPLLLVGWLAFTFVFGVAFTDAPRASYRLAAAMPAIFMLAALGIDRVLLVAASPRRWYRVLVGSVVLSVLAGWIAFENGQDFFVGYANGDGHETTNATAMQLMATHCDGREFYYLFEPEPIGPDWQLFCPDYRLITPERVPARIDPTRAATFLVANWKTAWLERLRECYPAARITEHRARDGRMLLTRVDVDAGELAQRPPCAALESGHGGR